jgi:hypothetical protein
MLTDQLRIALSEVLQRVADESNPARGGFAMGYVPAARLLFILSTMLRIGQDLD